ncbi:MAG TPA: sterol desaturase family protein [Rhodocyclaceae bacterium]
MNDWIFWAVGGFLFAEVAGYFIHRLLHADKVRILSRNHMIHHLLIYGPKRLRSEKYISPTAGDNSRFGIYGFGLEWIIPVVSMAAITLGVLHLIGVDWISRLIFIGAGLLWGYFMFGVVHDAMHLKNTIFEKNRFLRPWFRYVRRLHDLHHLKINEQGLMDKNFGICFFFMDRIFGTLSKSTTRLNKDNLKAALDRYSFIRG